MNLIFYLTLFLIGIVFGSFYTLAVHRIPKKQDIIHTHSYCPNCNHKLGFLDLIPVFSYLGLRAKCRYCKEPIRPRYFIMEIIAGIIFVGVASLMELSFEQLTIFKIVEYSFFVLYFTFIVLMAGIDYEEKKINQSVLMYGIIVSVLYIIYLYIVEKTSIYRYGIYLICFTIVLVMDTLWLKKKAKESYLLHIILITIIMAVFTTEYVTINAAIFTVIAILVDILIIRKRNNKNSIDKIEENENQRLEKMNIPVGFYLSIFNIVYYLYLLGI